MSAPLWAQRIITTVCEEEGIEEPTVNWRRRGKKWYATMEGMVQRQPAMSSGRTGKRDITVTAGGNSEDRRLVFYHELAHYVEMNTGDDNSRHDATFFARVFTYVKRFGYCTMRWAKYREYDYRIAAKAGYRQFRKEQKGS